MVLFLRTLSVILCLLTISCSGDRYEIDVSNVDYQANFLRLDHDLFHTKLGSNQINLDTINSVYGDFSSVYFEEIMRIGDPMNAMTENLALRFVEDPVWAELQVIIDDEFQTLQKEELAIGLALRKSKILFGWNDLPQLVAYNSGYNIGIFPSDKWLGVGLEWYSGSKHEIISQLPPELFPQYKVDKMERKYLAPNAIKGQLLFKFQDRINGDALLSEMVFAGKILFIVSKLLELERDELILSYSEAQLLWCEEKSFDVWKYFVENDLFFSEEAMMINKVMNDGPFTPGMPPESPGGVGNWVGLRMVRNFMDDHSEISLDDLMKMKNDQIFLEYFKPSK